MILTEYHQQAINLLSRAYSEDFCAFVTQNERYIDLLTELASYYIDRNIPIVDEDAHSDLGLSLVESISLGVTA